MDKLQIFVCENFYPEYKASLQKEGIFDIELNAYPTLCDHKGKNKEVKELLSKGDKGQKILACSKSCDALKFLDRNNSMDSITGNYCFSHLTCDEFLDYLTSQGSYIVSTGWLKQWQNHLFVMGFDRDMARSFFKATSKQIVFLDAKVDEQAESRLEELSSYLDIPYLIVPIELDTIGLMLKSKLYQWRLHHQNTSNIKVINELRSQSADYAAVFDMLGKVSTYTNKRDVISKVKELFMMVFGAQSFQFWNEDSDFMPIEIKEFRSEDVQYTLLKEEYRFFIKVMWEGRLYGMLDASGFMFPQYIERYLNLALDITKFLGLVFHNNEQYEKILKSEKELKYISFHDSMTGLYNRTYINQLLTNEVKRGHAIVFMFDIDKLKHVNDNFGHAAGDKLITSFAEVLRKCFRETDIVARIGGDEFTAILYEENLKTAIATQKRLLELIRISNENLEDKYIELSVSIGYALGENDNETIEDLMKKADASMYDDKMKRCKK